jgi:hypothetical protein
MRKLARFGARVASQSALPLRSAPSSIMSGSTSFSSEISIFSSVLRIADGAKCRTTREVASILARF